MDLRLKFVADSDDFVLMLYNPNYICLMATRL